MSYDYRILYDSPVGAWTFNTSAALMTDITGNAHDAVTNPRANILSNPSFETNTSGWTTLDLAMGSIARDSPATPFVVNDVTNPNAVTNTTGASYPNSTSDGTTTRITGSGCPVSDTAFQFSQPANGARTYDYVAFTITPKPAAGDTVSISYWVRSTDASVTSISTSIADGNGLNVNWSTSFDTVTTSWTKIVKVATFGTSTSTSNVLYIVPNHGGTTSAKTFQIAAAQVQSCSVNTPFIPQSGTSSLKASNGAFSRQTTEERTRYTASAYVYPPANGVYGVYLTGGPTPTTDSGVSRRYTMIQNGPGPIIEEVTNNLCTNPSFTNDLNGWTATIGGRATPARVPFGFLSQWAMKVYPSTNGDATGALFPQFTVASGKTFTASIYAKVLSGTQPTSALTIGTFTASYGITGTPATLTQGAQTATSVGNGWYRLTSTVTTTSTGELRFYVRGSTDVNGTTYLVSNAQVEQKAYATSFVDGGLGTGYSFDTTTNLVSNGDFETNTTGWEGLRKNLLTANQSSLETDTTGWAGSNASIARTTAQSLTGTASLAITASGGSAYAVTPTGTSAVPIIPGQVYTATASFRAATTPRQVRIYLDFFSASGADLGNVISAAQFTDNDSGWTQATITTQAPTNAAYVSLVCQVIGATAAEVHYIDAISLMPDPSGNLSTNSDFETGLGGVVASGGVPPTLSVTTAQAYTGKQSLLVTWPTTTVNNSYAAIDNGVLTIGQTYIASAWVYVPTGSPTPRITISGAAGQNAEASTTVKNSWVRIWTTWTATATNNFPIRIYNLTASTSGQQVYVDAVQIVVGSSSPTYYAPQTTNLVLNPSVETDLSNTQAYFSPTITRDTSIYYVGTASAKVVTSGGAFPEGIIYRSVAACNGATPGQVTGSLYLKATAGQQFTIKIRGLTNDQDFTTLADNYGSANFTATGGWDRVTLSNTTGPTGRWYAGVSIHTLGAVAAGVTFYVDAAQVEYGAYASKYIDGSLGAGYSWETSSNLLSAAASSFEDGSVGGWSSVTNATVANSAVQAFSGTKSLAVTATASAMTAVASATGTSGVKVSPGATYTASWFVYPTAIRDLRLVVKWYTSSGTASATPNSVGGDATYSANAWQRRSETFTAPSDAAYAAVQVQMGATGTVPAASEVFYVDAVQFEQKDHATPYGSAGTNNGSPSRRISPWVLGGTSLESITRIGSAAPSGAYVLAVENTTNYGSYGGPFGTQTVVSVSPSTTYAFSVYTQSAYSINVVDLVTGSALATLVDISGGQVAVNRDAINFTTGSTTTSVALQVVSMADHFYNGYKGQLAFVDGVQLEARDYTTAFVNGTVAGSVGKTSTRAVSALEYGINIGGAYPSTGLQPPFTILGYVKIGNVTQGGLFGLVNGNGSRTSALVANGTGIQGTVIAGTATAAVGAPASGDIVFAAISYDGTTLKVHASRNGAVPTVASSTYSYDPFVDPSSGGLYRFEIANPFPYAATNSPGENFMAFNSVLSNSEIANLVSGTTKPSVMAVRSDCVFSAFVNDGPAQNATLTAGQWTRISNTEDTSSNQTVSDIVVTGPTLGYDLPLFIDAVQLERGASATPYFESNTLVLSMVDMPIVSRGINAIRLASDDSLSLPVTDLLYTGTENRSFSLEAWFKPQSSSDYGWLFKRNRGGLKYEGNTLTFTLPMAAPVEAKWEGAVIGNNYHVVAVYDTNAAYLYVNKELVATARLTSADQAFGFPTEVASSLTISVIGGFSMVVDSPAVYNYALTQRDVSAHYAYGTNHPYSVDTSSAFPSNTFEINDARATIKYLYEANTTQVWDAGIITGDLSVVSDTLQSNYDSNGSAYGAGTWIGSFAVPAEATTTVGSRISWVASRYTGYTVSVSTDGTTFTPVTNFSQPFGALNLVAGQTLYVKIAVDAGITATVFSDLRVAIYGTKAVAAANNNVIALTLSNEVAMTLGENTVNPATFCDNTGYGLVGTTSKLSIAQDATFGGYQATEFYAKWAANTPSSTFFYTAENTSAVTLDSAGEFVVKPGYLMYVDGQLLYNFAPDPSFESNTFSPVFQGNGTTITRQSATVRTGSYAWQVVTPGTGSNEGIQNMGVTPAGAISAGDVVTVTIYARGTGNVQLEARCGNSGNTFIQSFFSTSTALSAGAWTRLSVTFTAPANSSVLSAKVNTPTTQAITFYVDDLQFEKSATASAFMIPAPTVNRWHHVVITHPATTAGANIGNSSANNAGFPMQIGYLAAHFNALTQANVTSLYTSIAGYAANRVIDTSVIGLVELNFPSTTKPYQLYSYDWSISSGG